MTLITKPQAKDPQVQRLYVDMLGNDLQRAKVVVDDLRNAVIRSAELQKQLIANLKIAEVRVKTLHDKMIVIQDKLRALKVKI